MLVVVSDYRNPTVRPGGKEQEKEREWRWVAGGSSVDTQEQMVTSEIGLVTEFPFPLSFAGRVRTAVEPRR